MSRTVSNTPKLSIDGKMSRAVSVSNTSPRLSRKVSLSVTSMRSPRASYGPRSPRSPACGISNASTSDLGSFSLSPSGSATISQASGSATIADSASSSGSVTISCGSGGSTGGSTTASRPLSKCVGTVNFQASLELASCGASAIFVKQAEEIFQGGLAALQDMCARESFVDALKCQGLEVHELQPGSRLSYTRRVGLLAAVLQEQSEAPQGERSVGAKLLHKQRSQNRVKGLGVIRRNDDHRSAVAQRQADLRKEQDDLRRMAEEEEEERVRRVAEQEQAIFEQFVEHSRQREERFRAAVLRGKEICEERTADCEAAMADQDVRVVQSLERRTEERVVRKNVSMLRFERVLDTVHQAHEDAELKTQFLQEKLEAKMKRSEDHIEHVHVNLQQTQQRKHEMEDEREHQILRVNRMHEHRRFHKVNELEEDREMFQECDRILKQTQRIVTDAVTGCRFLNLGTIALDS